MRCDIVRTVEELNNLRSEWNELLVDSRANNLFMTWEWLDSWRQLQDVAPSLVVICVRDEHERLQGLAPFYIRDYSLKGLLRYRVFCMAGNTNTGAEYQTWIARTTNEDLVFAQIVQGLRMIGSEWDLLWMPQLNGWSGTHESVTRAMEAGGFVVNQRSNVFSAFSLPGSFDLYLKQMSGNRRQQLRRMSRKILGDPNVEIAKITAQDDLGPALNALFELHGKRWQAVGEKGVFAGKPKEKAFYERFAPVALERGWLAMYVLRDDGAPRAVQLGYAYAGVFLQLQEGFDPDYSAHVGNVLRAFVIEDCISSGIREYDFLGGTSEHKRRWLSRERRGVDLLAARPGLKNMLVMRAGVWPTGAHLRPAAERPEESSRGH